MNGVGSAESRVRASRNLGPSCFTQVGDGAMRVFF